MRIGILGTGVVGQTIATKLEMLLPIWLRLWGAFKSPNINFHLARP
jgi:hypothetical protein